MDALAQIDNKFSKVMVNTSKLSDALSNTAHYLPIKNVIIDEGMPSFRCMYNFSLFNYIPLSHLF